MLAVFVCMILSGALVLLFGGAVDEAVVPSPPLVGVKASHRVCRIDEDCVIVHVDCSGCSCGVAMHREHEGFYRASYGDICRDYSGPVCEVYCPEIAPACQSGQCVAG